jgi:hypothetical protein
MTLNELKKEVAALGFEPGADTDAIFISAANRALAMISAELPVLKTLRAPACPYAPTYYLAALYHSAGERIELALSGKAYTFYLSGKGKFTEISDSGRITYDFDASLTERRGLINGSVRLVFEGDGNFDVLELSVYDRLVGKGLDGIPKVQDNRINPDDLVDDFAAFADLPRDSRGRLIKGARFDGREIVLPAEYHGITTVRYESKPKRITSDTAVIDLNAYALYLLPVLTAYFVWLDDEPRLAESYLDLYRKLMETAKRRSASCSAEYIDIARWGG